MPAGCIRNAGLYVSLSEPMTPAAPAEKPATAERSAQDEPTQADEDEVRTMSLDDLLDDIHNM